MSCSRPHTTMCPCTAVLGTSMCPSSSPDTICACIPAPAWLPHMDQKGVGHTAVVDVPIPAAILPVPMHVLAQHDTSAAHPSHTHPSRTGCLAVTSQCPPLACTLLLVQHQRQRERQQTRAVQQTVQPWEGAQTRAQQSSAKQQQRVASHSRTRCV